MRVARVIGTVTLNKQLEALVPGQLLIGEVLDAPAMRGVAKNAPRQSEMPQSLVIYDSLGAGFGQLVAVSEGREAAAPFYPQPVPIDAFSAAILDELEWQAPAPGS